MSRITWSNVGERFYENGVDQGVLYVDLSPAGVPWTGLVSVSESPSGGESRPFYQDGIKYVNIAAAEEFEATLAAFTCPQEFGACDGMTTLNTGLFAAQQKRKRFSLSYRTMIGNDTNGADHAYKIHLVYNALASPSERANSTRSNDNTPNTLTWKITTRAPRVVGMKPTAHFVIDSRFANPTKLGNAENVLYGTYTTAPRMPTVVELIALFA